MENASTYFDAWMKSQQQAFAVLREQALQMQNLMQSTVTDNNNPFTAWSKAAFEAFNTGASGDLAKDMLARSMEGSKIMQALFEQWQPLLQSLRDNPADPEAYRQLLDPAKIKQLVDQLFHFDPDTITRLQQQTAQAAAFYEQYGKPWLDAMQQGFSTPPGQAQHDSAFKSMQNMFSAFDQSIGRIWGMPAVGKDREKLELMNQCTAAMSAYAARNAEYQHLMYSTGLEAAQALTKELASKAQAGEKLDKFDTLFALWIDVNEKTFNRLFQTKAFTQKRNAVAEAGFKARKLYMALAESQMADVPVARRSEMDELYKTVYELRKQVKTLEKQLQARKGASHE